MRRRVILMIHALVYGVAVAGIVHMVRTERELDELTRECVMIHMQQSERERRFIEGWQRWLGVHKLRPGLDM